MFIAMGGPTGAAGINGAKGDKGDKGDTGETGPVGPGNCNMKTGTYVGDAVDNRNVNIGIDLASKTYKFIIIKNPSTQVGMMRTEYGQGDLTMNFGAIADQANCVQSFTETGFQLGSAAMVNQVTLLYRYIAFWVD